MPHKGMALRGCGRPTDPTASQRTEPITRPARCAGTRRSATSTSWSTPELDELRRRLRLRREDEQRLRGAKRREAKLRNRAARRTRWLQHQVAGVRQRNNFQRRWAQPRRPPEQVQAVGLPDQDRFSFKTYATKDKAKLALFVTTLDRDPGWRPAVEGGLIQQAVEPCADQDASNNENRLD